jgi:hypothetical protein
MDTEWGPDVFDFSYAEREHNMGIPKYARIPKQFSEMRGKLIEKRLVLDPLWAFDSFRDVDQVHESYSFNKLEEIKTGYGSAKQVLTRTLPEIETKRGITEAYVEKLLDRAKPGMSPKELHEGVIVDMAEGFLKKRFEEYLKNMEVNHNDEMERMMLNIAKNIHIFDYAQKSFERVLSHVFAESMFCYVPKRTV